MLRVSEIRICLEVRLFLYLFCNPGGAPVTGWVWRERAVAEPGLPPALPKSEK